ncbi:MAG: hypothetical protein V4574_16160 [Pseudomonadota bacterium]
MRPILLSALSLAALAAALPAHAQGREKPSCDRERALIAQLETEDNAERVAAIRRESEYRDRYAALNRQIAELNVSRRNPALLQKLRGERTWVLQNINEARARQNVPVVPDPRIATARARMVANRCAARPGGRPAPPATAARPSTRPATPPAWTYPPPRGRAAAPARPATTTRPSTRPAAPPAWTYPLPTTIPPAPSRPAATPYSAWMTGRFNSSSGMMTLSPGGGNYEQYGGTLAVTAINGATMEGTWRQTASGGQCPDGSHRGRFSFTFTATGFTGSWSYCDAAPNKGGWNGTRVN